MEVNHRELAATTFMGEGLHFVAANDRIRERVEHLSHERHVLEKLVEVTGPDEVFWDVGACLGIHSFVVAKHLADGHVIGFEPMPSNRGVLIDNMHVNRLDNVRVQQTALADADGTAEFAIRESLQAGFGRHGLEAEGEEYDSLHTIDVDTAQGDTLVTHGDAPRPNVVKIDVEGASPLVLEGMKDILASDECHDVILETHEPNPVQPSHEDFGATTEELISTLESYGFTVENLVTEFHLYATKQTSDGADTDTSSFDGITIIQGDIAEQSADALVNAAGTGLRMGSGVAGALRRAGGEELNREAITQGPVDLGDAVVTDAYDLDANYVIHAAAMPHHGDGQATFASIRTAVRNALDAAEERGCESIVFPAVGCGLAGVSLVDGVPVIFDELRSFDGSSLTDIRFIAYSDDEYQTAKWALESQLG